mgnify:CR=1 FL=1
MLPQAFDQCGCDVGTSQPKPLVQRREPDAGLDPIPGADDCDEPGEAAVYNVERFLFVARADADGNAIGCIDDAVPDSDVVVIKSVRPRPLSDGVRGDESDDDGTIDTPESLDAETTYVMANAINGVLSLVRVFVDR